MHGAPAKTGEKGVRYFNGKLKKGLEGKIISPILHMSNPRWFIR